MEWTCPNCETTNAGNGTACEVCGYTPKASSHWICSFCETKNPDYLNECEVCGTSLAISDKWNPEIHTTGTQPEGSNNADWTIDPSNEIRAVPAIIPAKPVEEKVRKKWLARNKRIGNLIFLSYFTLPILAIILVSMSGIADAIVPAAFVGAILAYGLNKVLDTYKIKELPEILKVSAPEIPENTRKPRTISALCFDGLGKYLAIANSDGRVLIEDYQNGKLVSNMELEQTGERKIFLTTNGILALSTTGVRTWNYQGKWESDYETGIVLSGAEIAVAPSGSQIAIAKHAAFMKIVDVLNHEDHVISSDKATMLAPVLKFSFLGDLLVFQIIREAIQIMDLRQRKIIGRIPTSGERYRDFAISRNEDGVYILYGLDELGQLNIWEEHKGLVKQIDLDSFFVSKGLTAGYLNRLQLSASNADLFLQGQEGMITVLSTPEIHLKRQFEGHPAIGFAISLKGDRIALVNENGLVEIHDLG